jgi:hypothetical protein
MPVLRPSRRSRVSAVLALALLTLAPLPARAEPGPGRPARRGFRLFANAIQTMNVNRVTCDITSFGSFGSICRSDVSYSGSPGGVWPRGTIDMYLFGSGPQAAGIVSMTDATHPWAGDTSATFDFEEGVRPIYSWADPADVSNWPDAARVPSGDPSEALYNPLLRGLTNASQGDLWWMSWDGNPSLGYIGFKRNHPLGLAIEYRALAWNYPRGNEDIIYLVMTLYNVTSKDAAAYALARPSIQPILLEQAQRFHQLNAAKFGISLPSAGYDIKDLYVSYFVDPDIAFFAENYASVNLPYSMGFAYQNDFGLNGNVPEGWSFPPSLFSPPFFSGVGFAGAKYLKTPVDPLTGQDVGITLFSTFANPGLMPGALNDPGNPQELYRLMIGAPDPSQGDGQCNSGNTAVSHLCYINNVAPTDMRLFQSSGPLQLKPGQQASIAIALILAAPVATPTCAVSCSIRPGDPTVLLDPATAANANAVDTMTGFRRYLGDLDGDGQVDQEEIDAVPGSLLGKARLAQAVFDNRFLLPFAPDSPEFFLVPGDNQVTVLWKPSPSEASEGDPFFSVASQPSLIGGVPNPLYDPNYRKFDVEGYRIYRGRVDAPNELALIAQFDYQGTFISDFTGVVNAGDACAPEYGLYAGCAGPVAPNPKDGTALTGHVDHELAGEVIQVRAGSGRTPLANGTQVYVLAADTAVTGGGEAGSCGPRTACPALNNTGVPFVYVDRNVRSHFRYFYSVTAFDVNSLESGPSSLESARSTRAVTPTRPASNYESSATLAVHVKGSRPDPAHPGAFILIDENQDEKFPRTPTIDPVSGRFGGPFPPADGTTLGFVGEFAKEVVGASGSLVMTLDSIGAGSAYDNTATTYYMTAAAAGSPPSHFTIPIVQDQFDATHSDVRLFEALNIDDDLAKRYGGDGSYTLQAQVEVNMPGNYYTNSFGRGCVNGAPGFDLGAGCQYNGPRWFNGPSPQNNETKAHPNDGNWANFTAPYSMNRAPVNGITNGGFNNAGELSGVEVIHQPYSYNTMGNQYRDVEGVLGPYKRAADYNVYWSSSTAGLIDSVIDVTHNVEVPFDSLRMNASYGLLTAALSPTSGTGTLSSFDQRAEVSNTDFGCVEPMRSSNAAGSRIACGGTNAGGDGPVYTLTRQASIDPVVFFTISPTDVRTSTNTGTGFAMYIAGNTFLFQTATLPSGTVWSLRDYVGAIAGGNGWGGDVGPYTYFKQDALTNIPLPFSAVGGSISVDFDVVNQVRAPKYANLKQVHTVPDPYYVTNHYEQTTDFKILKFVNLPAQAIIRIYSASGILVTVLEHNSTELGGEESWNLLNRNGLVVASGVYFYHIEAGDARRVGRFTVVNWAQ